MLYRTLRYAYLCLLICALSFGIITPVQAQVVSDGTLSTVVTSPDGLNFTVNQGTQSGDNEFYSFAEFSIPTGGSVAFDNTDNVENLFIRVTGSEDSIIDGLVSANGTANLFLIEDVPLEFDRNAELQIGGSFVPTTAESIAFADGLTFGFATTSAALSASLPTELHFGQSPASIELEGPGQSLTGDLLTPIDSSNSPQQLTLSTGQTFALVGGELNSNRVVITAPAGHIALGAVGDGEVVGLIPSSTGFMLDYSDVEEFGTIKLKNRSLANVSGAPSGSIQVNAARLRLRNGSLLLGQNFGDQPGGDITLSATRFINARGTKPDTETTGIGSGAISETFGLGTGGKIVVTTQELSITEGGGFITEGFGPGLTGNLEVNASDSIELIGTAAQNPLTFSVIVSIPFGSGDGGNITVSTQDLIIAEAAGINSGNVGTGVGGNVLVNADVVTINGVQPVTLSESNIGASNIANGQVGNITVNARQIFVQDGALLNADNSGNGSAGVVLVNASEFVEVSGLDPFGGNERAQVGANTLKATPEAAAVFGLPLIPTGNAGIITINTPNLRVFDGAKVNADNEGIGDAGLIKLQVDEITIDTGGSINASAMDGHGGTIDLEATTLNLNNGGFITTDAIEAGNAGIIDLVASQITLKNNSSIDANAAQTGTGGIIEIDASQITGVYSSILSLSEKGSNGSIHILASEISPNINISPTPSISCPAEDSGCSH